MGRRHDAAFLDRVVEQGETGRGAGTAALLETHFLEDVGDGVADGRGRGEGEVDDAEGDVEPAGGLVGDQLADPRDLERGVLDEFCHFGDVGVGDLFERMADDTGAGDADVDDTVGLTGAVEGACHEGVVFDGVAEDDQFGGGDTFAVGRLFRALPDDLPHEGDRVHVDAGLGGADVDARTDMVCDGEGFRDGADERFIAGREAFLDQSGVPAEVVGADFLRGALQGQRVLDRVSAAGGEDHGDRGDGNAFIDDGDAVLPLDVLTGLYEMFRFADDLLVDAVAGPVDVRVGAVEQGDTHRDGSDVEVFLVDHVYGLEDIRSVEVDHRCLLKCDAWC